MANLSWDVAPGAATYDVYRKSGSGVPAGSGAGGVCLESGLTLESLTDTEVPPPNGSFCYLVRAANACGAGTWGNASDDTPRTIAVCP